MIRSGDILDRIETKRRHALARKVMAALPTGFGHIYFITTEWEDTSDQYVKIGYAVNPFRRLADLQPACPLDLYLEGWVVGTERDEVALHDEIDRVSMLRHRGEWFVLTSQLEEALDCVKAFDRKRNREHTNGYLLTPNSTAIQRYVDAVGEAGHLWPRPEADET